MTAPTGPDRTGVVARLDALEAAHKAATPGEWVTDVPGMIHNNPVGRVKGGYIASVEHPENAAAIVAEHNALPALIAAVRGVLALADEMDDQLAATGVRLDRCIRPGDRIRSTVAAALGEA